MIHHAQPSVFSFFRGRSIEIQQVDEQFSSDGGLLVFRELDEKLNLTASFAAVIPDARSSCVHSLLSVIRQRVYAIIAGYEDQNDHDTLRSDPVFKLIADGLPDGDDLASQPTISRVENSVTAGALLKLEHWFVDRFVDSFDDPPRRITLDIDTFADPTHGQQQLTFFNGFYGQYQYQVRVLTCAENEQIVLPVLLFGTASVALGADDDLTRTIDALRKRYPDVEIHVRADSGFARPHVYKALESRPGVTYSIGYQMNQLMQKKSEELMQKTLSEYERTGEDQRAYMHLRHRSRNWEHEHDLVIKCEATANGTNRRIVITNRPGAAQYPDGVYEEYGDRGESENRNKELSLDLAGGRLSDHRFMANVFRMMLHCLAYNLLARLRAIPGLPDITPEFDGEGLPTEASTEKHKRTWRNRRRRHDPLVRGQAMTWRTLVIKVAARVITSRRHIRLLIPANWPHADYLARVSASLAAYFPSG